MKQRLVTVWLFVFALWPLVHYGLVRVYGVDRSRLGGWAEDAAPDFPLQVALFTIDFRSAKSMEDIKVIGVPRSQWSAGLIAEWQTYSERRRAYGSLAAPPDALGRKLLAEHGDTGMVLVAVSTSTLDRSTKTVDVKLDKYPYSVREK